MKFLAVLVVVFAVATSLAQELNGAIPLAFIENEDVAATLSVEIAKKFSNEYSKYLRTGVETPLLREIYNQLAETHTEKDILTQNIGDLASADQFVLCTTCRAVVNVVADEFLNPDGEFHSIEDQAKFRAFGIEICLRLKIGTEEFCTGFYDVNEPFVKYILKNTLANSQSACGMLPFSICQIRQPEFNFTLAIDGSGSPVTESKADFPGKNNNDLHILHLTDIHFDPEYQPGSLAACPNVLCCRDGDSSSVSSGDQAGYWSDYRDCDSPLHMIEDAFDHMAKTHTEIEYIYQTGDIVPHNIWSTTRESNLMHITKITDLIESKFPNIPIYPCVGNHESHPVNIFGTNDMPEEVSIGWLYESLWTTWSKWLPASAKDTVLEGGYYTVSPKTGFRIISLNNNYGYLANFFLFHDGRVAVKQLEWLHDTLLNAEKAGEYVHILMHIPSADADCWTVWAREFNRITERFHRIISGIFTGHTHRDEMNVHYNEDGDAIATTFNGGSLTTYSHTNPNYKMYEVNSNNMQVVDAHTWIFNLTEANMHGDHRSPIWYKSHSYSVDYTEDLSPSGLNQLLHTMAEKPDLVHKFWEQKWTLGDNKLKQGCNNKCLLSTICRIATSVYDQKDKCRQLQNILHNHLPEESTTPEPTTTEVPTTTEPPEDGAITMGAFKLTTLLTILCLVKFLY